MSTIKTEQNRHGVWRCYGRLTMSVVEQFTETVFEDDTADAAQFKMREYIFSTKSYPNFYYWADPKPYRKKMPQSQRDKIFEMFTGKCAFCGGYLVKGWHVSSVQDLQDFIWSYISKTLATPDMLPFLPSCQSCNGVRGKLTIEGFRRKIAGDLFFIQEACIQYRTSLRFGLVEETAKEVIFYLEKLFN